MYFFYYQLILLQLLFDMNIIYKYLINKKIHIYLIIYIIINNFFI